MTEEALIMVYKDFFLVSFYVFRPQGNQNVRRGALVTVFQECHWRSKNNKNIENSIKLTVRLCLRLVARLPIESWREKTFEPWAFSPNAKFKLTKEMTYIYGKIDKAA